MRPDGTTASLPPEVAKASQERARRVWSVIGWGALALIVLGMAPNLFLLASGSDWGFFLLVPVLTLVFGLLLWRLVGRKKPA
jgi:hypothetical protein